MSDASIEVKGLHDAVRLARQLQQDVGTSVKHKAARLEELKGYIEILTQYDATPCLLYTSPSPRDKRQSRMPSSA